MPRVWAPLKRTGQLALAVLAGTAFFAPALAVFATSKPAVALAMRRPHAVIAVHPFFDLAVTTASTLLPYTKAPSSGPAR